MALRDSTRGEPRRWLRQGMIVAFDLDDTLYDETQFVTSGLDAVAKAAAEELGLEICAARSVLEHAWRTQPRGHAIDELLRHFDCHTRTRARRLIDVYRRHAPSIRCPDVTWHVLDELARHPLYLVTDGHKLVQASKIRALGLADRFRRCLITNRYGIRFQKPSPFVFERILERERCAPRDVVYVGDDPTCDFLGIRPLGFRTIRVRTGRHAHVQVPDYQDAECSVAGLELVPGVIRQWEAS
jgi:putative hydrolase of the HAD superfamily